MKNHSFSVKQVSALVVGTGISGLFTALKLAGAGVQTLLITKSALDESNSRYAQGGIAAVLPSNPDDSLDLHLQDTIRAGAGLCNEPSARSILAEGYASIEDLLFYGVPFDRNPDNQLALTREAAHSVQRILHAGGDATGHSVEMALIDKVRKNPLIEVMEYAQVVELLLADGVCQGCRAVDYHNHKEVVVYSPHTVLATGGIGRIYSHTTNPAIATGDGIALAAQAGTAIENMEFIQFHPTAFYADGQLHFLVSEALRGEGGLLRDGQGQLFAKKYHPDGELAPRDIVTRAIYAEMRASNLPYVYLDITHLPAETIEKRFPTILSSCLKFGVDIRKDWIPVAPAAHYLMGGITVDVEGKTTVPGLYSVGETAYTGLHGANRLASNSLLECVVLARRVSRYIEENPKALIAKDASISSGQYSYESQSAMFEALGKLHDLMWQQVGILRSGDGLKRALTELQILEAQVVANHWQQVIPVGFELMSQLKVARLIAQAALDRCESRGAHTRLDFPEPDSVLPMKTLSSATVGAAVP